MNAGFAIRSKNNALQTSEFIIMRLTLPLPLLRILLASLLVPVSLSFSASAGTITDKTLTQADADSQIRYNTENLRYTSPGTRYEFVLGDGPMNMTVSESITYSGYTYDYPGQTKAANDGWTSSGVIVADPVKGNVIQGYAGGWGDYSDRNTIKGDADRSYDLVFSGNAAERTTPVTQFLSSLSAGGAAVYLTNAGISDLNLLSFVNNTLDNQLSSITQGYTTYYSQAEGGALWISKGIVSNINEIRFEGNTASSMARTNGGAAFMDGETLMENIGSLTFENNRATSPEWTMGGALYLQGTATIQNTESVSFINNVSEMNKEGGDAYGGGLASNEGGRKFYFKSVGRLLFSGNTVTQAAALDSGWKGLGRLWGEPSIIPASFTCRIREKWSSRTIALMGQLMPSVPQVCKEELFVPRVLWCSKAITAFFLRTTERSDIRTPSGTICPMLPTFLP